MQRTAAHPSQCEHPSDSSKGDSSNEPQLNLIPLLIPPLLFGKISTELS